MESRKPNTKECFLSNSLYELCNNDKKKPMAFKAAWLGSKSKEGISTKARLVVILVGRERCVWEEAQGKILERLVYQLLIS